MVARKNNSLHPKQAKFLFPVAKAGSFMHPFFHKQRIWMQRPRIKGKILHTKTQETGILVAKWKDNTRGRVCGLLRDMLKCLCQLMGSKSAAPCLHSGQTMSSGSSSPS